MRLILMMKYLRTIMTASCFQRVLAVSFLTATLLFLAGPQIARAQYATGGSGKYRNDILWFSWGTANTFVPQEGLTVTKSYQVGTTNLAVTCTLDNITSTDSDPAPDLLIYRPGDWHQDGLDDLYNIGGTGTANQLVIGIRNYVQGALVSFDLDCDATSDGQPFILSGLVFADAEANDPTEYIQFTLPAGSGFHVLEALRADGCTNTYQFTVDGSGTYKGRAPQGSCPTGPMAVGFIEGASSATFQIKGYGLTAIAVGVMLDGFDAGDAPAQYGEAWHLQHAGVSGGTIPPNSTQNIFAPGFTFASVQPQGLRLGATADVDVQNHASAGADGDDLEGDDEDGVTLPAVARIGRTMSIPVVVNGGDGILSAWFDWNQDGDWSDAGEQTVTDLPVNGTTNLDVTVPADALLGDTYARFRLSGVTGKEPTGPAGTGEVEDYRLTVADPELIVTKEDTLLTDADGSGTASPGDTLHYTILIENALNTGLVNAQYSDSTGVNTTLVVGSVTTTQGTVVTGNSANDTHVAVTIGNVAVGGLVTIAYDVTINNPFPVEFENLGVAQLSNQGILTVANPDIPDRATDDPDDPSPGDATDTRIDAKPVLQAFKQASLFVDADNNGEIGPGDTLQYLVTIINSGNEDDAGIVYTDTPDPNTTLLNGSVTTSVGTVTGGNGAGDNQVSVNVDLLSGQGGQALVTYNVLIKNPLPAGVTAVRNQGLVTSNDPNVPDTPTDDPDDPTLSDPTEISVVASPRIEAHKDDILLVDADGNGFPSPGDTLLYNVSIVNSGNQETTGVIFNDALNPNVRLEVGSVASNLGTVSLGNVAGDTTVQVGIGALPGGATANLSFQALINNPLPAGVTTVSNQGIVTSDDPKVPDTPTDDPDDPTPIDATETPVDASPRIAASKDDILLVDADGNGFASPGDTLLYNVTIMNSGNQAAAGLLFQDTLDPNTTLVSGSIGTSFGTITQTNTANTIAIDIGMVPGGGTTAYISFQAVINNPLAAGVTKLNNQGIVTSDDPKVPDTLTDDPEDPAPDDPTETPVDASPRIDAQMDDILLVDADNNGVSSPGDTLLYNVSIANSGNQAAAGVGFTVALDPNTTLVVGSVSSNLGTITQGNANLGMITQGNAASDSTIGVDIGTLPAGENAYISYQAVIINPLPAGVTKVSNQGIVTSDDPKVPDTPTDDPDDPTPDDPTVTPVLAAAQIDAFKSDLLFIDADDNGRASPGDTLSYNITVVNTGNQATTNLRFTDSLDPNSTMVAGSLTTDRGTIVEGNDGTDRTIVINIGTLPGGAEATISFHVTINNPLPAGVTTVSNQGIVTSDDPKVADISTDDPSDLMQDDPTDTPIDAAPRVDLFKSENLLIDADDDGVPTPGDTLIYNISIVNSGNQAAAGVLFDDAPDPNTTLVVGSVSSDRGTITQGNAAGNTTVQVNIGALPGGGATATISYHALIKNPLPANIIQVSNQGSLSGSNISSMFSDDPATPGLPKDSTQVLITRTPKLQAHKQVSLLLDGDTILGASAGDTLLYTVQIINSGNTAATGVSFSDTPDANSTLVAGSVHATLGNVLSGNGATDRAITVNIGALASGEKVLITYQVKINNVLPLGVSSIRNQGLVNSDNDITPCPEDQSARAVNGPMNVQCPQILTNDPGTAAIGDATIITLRRDPTAEEPTGQPSRPGAIYLPLLNYEQAP